MDYRVPAAVEHDQDRGRSGAQRTGSARSWTIGCAPQSGATKVAAGASEQREKLATLKTAFRENGRVTAGNASQVSDGASAILVMSAKAAREFSLRPRARLKAQLVVGVDPELMLTGPIPATKEILPKHWAACHHTRNFEQAPVTIPQLSHRRTVVATATERPDVAMIEKPTAVQ